MGDLELHKKAHLDLLELIKQRGAKPMNEVKSFVTSKTFWIGGMAPIAIAVIDAVTNGADWRQAVFAGLGAVSILLRKLTTGGMDFSLPKEK